MFQCHHTDLRFVSERSVLHKRHNLNVAGVSYNDMVRRLFGLLGILRDNGGYVGPSWSSA